MDRDTAMEQQAEAVAARDAASEKQRRSEAETAKKLGDLGVLSGQSVSQAVSTSDSASAGLDADKAAMAAAAGAVKADHARLAQTQLQMNFADVVAPISGRAGAAMVKAGNVPENDTTLVTLLQLAPIHVTFGIPEQALVDVQRWSAQGPLEVEAGTGTMAKGRLDFIDNVVDAATGTIRLKASFANALIVPGDHSADRHREEGFRSWPNGRSVSNAPIAAGGSADKIVMGWMKLRRHSLSPQSRVSVC